MVKSIFLKLLKCPPLTSLQNETFVCKKSVCKRLCVKSLLCVKRLCVKAFLCQHICVSIMFYGSAQRLCVKSPRCVYIYIRIYVVLVRRSWEAIFRVMDIQCASCHFIGGISGTVCEVTTSTLCCCCSSSTFRWASDFL